MTHPVPSVARKAWQILTPKERRSAVVLLGLMMVGMGLETLGVGMILPAMALLLQSPDELALRFPLIGKLTGALGSPAKQELVIGGLLCVMAVYLVKAVFLAGLVFFQTRFAYVAQANLSQRLFRLYIHQPYAFHLQRNSALLVQNVIREVDMLFSSTVLPGLALVAELLVVAGLVCLLLFVEPLGTVIMVTLFVLAGFAYYRMTSRHLARWGAQRQQHEVWRMQHLTQGLGGAKEVKLLGREAEFLRRYDGHNILSARAAERHQTVVQLPRLWLEWLAITALTVLALYLVASGRAVESVLPTLGLFAAAGFRLLPSANRILSTAQTLRYGLPVVHVMHEELTRLTAEDRVESNPGPSPMQEGIELREVSFTYEGSDKPALSKVSITIRKGESVGFVGTSGAGKSTLVDVILGLLAPGAGNVLVDGKDVRENIRAWQSQIGYVSQSIFLTDDTLRRNVALGVPDELIDEAALRKALDAAQLSMFVDTLAEGLETVVGERGVRLSGGQRQRIGIARALYHDPQVLVLDESTSALDTSTEAGVMEAIRALHGAKTILIVAHRLSTVEQCDRTYRIEGGSVEDHWENSDPRRGESRTANLPKSGPEHVQ